MGLLSSQGELGLLSSHGELGLLSGMVNGSTLWHGARASHCSDFSCCAAQVLECAGFTSCGSMAYQDFSARGIFLDQGSN